MKDLIERQAIINKLKPWLRISGYSEGELNMLNAILYELENMPSAQPERKNGKWIVGSEFEDCLYAKCNQCKVTQVFYYNKPLTNFCPSCGADMRGEQDG